MELFYTNYIENDAAYLEGQEHIHCTRVLRNKPGDTIHFTDGRGETYLAKIVSVQRKHTELQIVETLPGRESRCYRLHMGVALTKNIERYEWFLEKAVEIGVDEITPLVCEHSVRSTFKHERAERLILSAMKQSLKSKLPVLNKATDFSEFLSNTAFSENSLLMMGHCREGEKESVCSLLKSHNPEGSPDIVILIGPEGDFSVNEIEVLLESGFKAMHMGESRMRVETAALTAVNAVYLNYL